MRFKKYIYIYNEFKKYRLYEIITPNKYKYSQEQTPSIVFSVMYTICEGPKLDA